MKIGTGFSECSRVETGEETEVEVRERGVTSTETVWSEGRQGFMEYERRNNRGPTFRREVYLEAYWSRKSKYRIVFTVEESLERD